ncbi:MAG: hypothetical protein AB7L09_02745 [Nitrospira sp.]
MTRENKPTNRQLFNAASGWKEWGCTAAAIFFLPGIGLGQFLLNDHPKGAFPTGLIGAIFGMMLQCLGIALVVAIATGSISLG